jgi:hypothetical protein
MFCRHKGKVKGAKRQAAAIRFYYKESARTKWVVHRHTAGMLAFPCSDEFSARGNTSFATSSVRCEILELLASYLSTEGRGSGREDKG